ncbi:FliH/SctL family protein [uncultured Thiothrix sp.]|uniref:FliH/SctL family protein n=1 Tax=uncultured Thiothrix sp. TaxID=223185 RepID=UPI00262DB453|nr:FliH/SctL family protein [uncultured Thiothrix sp.]HMT91780.1 FliH/SctL family protein [Thiolinea sp.]
MDKFVSIKPLDSQLEPGKVVLKANDYRHLVNYETLVQEMALRDQAREQRATQVLTEAIQAGMQQGRAQAHDQVVQQLLGFTIKMHDNLRNIELALVQVVIDSVQQILHTFENRELVASTVRRGMDLIRSSKKLIIRVHPQMQDVVLEQLEEWQRTIVHIEVLPDTQLKLDECVLESDVGIIHASVEQQMESLIRALRKTFPLPKARPSP